MGAESTRPKQDRQCWPLTSSAELGAVTDPPMSDVGDEARGIDDVVVIGDEEAPEPPPPYEFDPTDVKPAAPGWTPPTPIRDPPATGPMSSITCAALVPAPRLSRRDVVDRAAARHTRRKLDGSRHPPVALGKTGSTSAPIAARRSLNMSTAQPGRGTSRSPRCPDLVFASRSSPTPGRRTRRHATSTAPSSRSTSCQPTVSASPMLHLAAVIGLQIGLEQALLHVVVDLATSAGDQR
jgi:hypothetical protein